MLSSIPPRFGAALRSFVLAFVVGACLLASEKAGAEVPAKCSFDLAPGAAEQTLKTFSEQSGRSLILATSVAAGVQTNAVRGELAPGEALRRMLAGTGLVAIEDPKNGAFTVRRERDDEAPRKSGP